MWEVAPSACHICQDRSCSVFLGFGEEFLFSLESATVVLKEADLSGANLSEALQLHL